MLQLFDVTDSDSLNFISIASEFVEEIVLLNNSIAHSSSDGLVQYKFRYLL